MSNLITNVFMRKFLLPFFLFGFVALMNAQTAAPEATNATTPGTLTFKATTIGTGSNVLAVWIKSSTAFVKTLIGSTSGYSNELTNWVSASSKSLTNATTGATRSHGAITTTWNGKDKNLTADLVDGTYTIYIETKQEGGSVRFGSYAFTKGPTAATLSPANVTYFSSVTLAWVPTAPAGINELQLSNLYSVYPNPTKSAVFVSGVDIKQIELCDLSGRRIFTSNEQKINLANLPKGTYLANVITEKGTFIKKIIKE